MPTEELKFEDLIKEYIEVIESTDVSKLKEENKVIKVDVERKEKEAEGIDARIEDLQSELNSLNENSTVKLEYPETIKDKEDKIKEAKNFKENKLKEIKDLKDKTKENNKRIRKVNNIGKDVIKKAEEKTNKENEKLQKKIEELEERKAKYGLKRIDKDGKESIQFTKEEKIVVKSIDEEIDKLKHEIKDNRKAFLILKKAIEDAKKDKEAFMALKNKVKGKEEPKEKPAQEKNNEQKPENAKEEPKKTDGIVHEEIPVEPAKKTTEKTGNNNPTPKPTGKTAKKKDEEEPVQEPTGEAKEKEENTDKPSREGKVEHKGKVIPGVPQPEYEIHEVKDPEEEKNIYSNSYETNLKEYKEMLSMYKDAFLSLGDLQQQYENGEIEYSEYEKQALYVAERYEFMKGEYAKIKQQYDIEKTKEYKFANITNEDLENKLKELDEETTELWQQGVHENTPDAKRYHEALEEMKKIKEEIQQRKENPLRGLSLEELEAKKRELYARIGEQQEPDEYELRTHKENGLEGYEDEIDKGLREIREEIERRQPKLEAPEEPAKAGMILEKEEGYIPPREENNLPVKSGLQVFREQFNQMPDIKDRHTLSERLKLLGPVGITAGALLLGNPAIGIPVIAASALSGPIAYRLTGQKKLEKQIEEQFLELAQESPEEFDKMIEYLSEEKVTELKPNTVILKALHKTMLKTTKAKSVELEQEKTDTESERDELLKKAKEVGLTEDEYEKLGKINARLIEIETVDAPKVERNLKDIKRGKDRVSAQYKGNLRTRFNIFAHRNSTTQEYSEPLNDYADAELERDIATANGDHIGAGLAQQEMNQVMEDNTYTNKLGIQTSVFNGRNSAVKLISDRRDNTVRNTCAGIVMAAGIARTVTKLAEFENAQAQSKEAFEQQREGIESLQKEVDSLDKDTMQGVADRNVTDAYAQAEHAIVHENGVTTSQSYRQGDIWAQQEGGNVASNSQIQGNDKVGWFDNLIETVKSRRGIAERYGDAADNLTLSPNATDHTAQTDFTSKAAEQIDADVTFLERMKGIVEKTTKLGDAPKFQEVKQSFLGPITTVIGYIMRGKGDRDNNREEKKNNEAVKIEESR